MVAVSTGNHGRAVAHAARLLGARATVFVSERVPAGKRTVLERAGAELHVIGAEQDEAEAHAREHADATGAAWIPPFDHPDVIAGQGTLGLELLDAVPDLDTVIVPLSGGGLIAGVAMAIRSVRPKVRVIGVSPRNGAAMIEALRAGCVVPTPQADTLADSLQGGLGSHNRYTVRMVRRWVHATVQVDEADLADAMRFAFERHRLVLEGAGAAAIAAVRSRARRDAVPVLAVPTEGEADEATDRAEAEHDEARNPSETGVTALLATG
ncbi:MAG: pyridoxal-phosphate dependent enzyme, partial [Trueperaceae bacterium]